MNASVAVAVLFGVVCIEGAAVIEAWRWWRRRRVAPRGPSIWAVVGTGLVGLVVFFAVTLAVGMLKAFRPVAAEDVDVSQKARLLAEGISEAMNGFAFAQIVLLPASVVVLVRARLRRRNTTRSDGPASS